PETALILRVHASNYRMIGFVESAPVAELASLGPPVVADIGSGLLDESTPWLAERPSWLRDEPGARQCLEAGAALVTFSGAKLLDTEAVAGGGSLPGLTIPSTGVALEVPDAEGALAALRALGIVARVDAGAVVCDLRTIDPSDDPRLASALATITP